MVKAKTPLVVRLEALYRDEPNPRWRRDLNYFKPSASGRRTCQLSDKATQFLIDRLCGRNSKSPTFILIEPEGDVRLGGMQVFEDWPLTVKVALDEGAYIYNARTKKCCRPIWTPNDEGRTLANLSFETVRLVPDKRVYDTQLPKVTSRLFATENK